jgi:DNA-binding NarL/FixJ family response regulator
MPVLIKEDFHPVLCLKSQDIKLNVSIDKTKKLSFRELEIIKLVCSGMHHRAIAQELQISFHTVDKHRKNILRKLELHNIASLSCFAIKNGLI